MSESLHAFLRSRRSVRRFKPQEVPQTLLERLLETACRAPSAHNRQPWRFAVATSHDIRLRLADEMAADFRRDLTADGLQAGEVEARAERSRRRILEAPALVVLCLDLRELDAYPDPARQEAERLMGVQSVALAGGTLLLAAHAEGLGAVWICAPLFAPEAVRRALGLPPAWQPQGMILLGYPAVLPEPRERKPLGEVILFL